MNQWSNKDIIFSHSAMGGWERPKKVGTMGFTLDIGGAITQAATKVATSAVSSLQTSAEGQINKILGVPPSAPPPPNYQYATNQSVLYMPAPAPLPPVVQAVSTPIPKAVWYAAGGVGALFLMLIAYKLVSKK